MARLKIGFVTPALYWGGAERWMLDLARLSADRLDWVGVASNSRMNRDNTMVELFEQIMPVYEHGRPAVRRVARRADVLLCWGAYNLRRLVAGFHGPVVFVGHGQGQFDRNAAAASYRGATHWAAVAGAATVPIVATGVPRDQIAVLYNGIDPQRCVQTRSRGDMRAELGVTEDQFLVGYVGRMVPEKNPRGVAEAVAMSPKRFRAVFVGGGWDRDRQRAHCRGVLGKRAIFVERIEDVGNYYRALDCFAQASPAEGFSMGMLEAMLCGVPCALTRVGVLPELERKHQVPAWESIEPGTPQTSEQLAAGIQHIASLSPAVLANRIDAARQIVQGHYLASHMAERWINYLHGIYAESRANLQPAVA